METVTQFFIDWGYWGLFVSALVAGSILPFSSEAVMVILVGMGSIRRGVSSPHRRAIRWEA